MPLTLPPPPKSRGIFGLLVTLIFVGWTGWLLVKDTAKKPAPVKVAPVTDSGPAYIEIDLRGPQFETGRYVGFQKGSEAKLAGFTAPAENVLAFNAAEAAREQSLDKDASEDFSAGYQSGYTQAIKSEITPVAPRK